MWGRINTNTSRVTSLLIASVCFAYACTSFSEGTNTAGGAASDASSDALANNNNNNGNTTSDATSPSPPRLYVAGGEDTGSGSPSASVRFADVFESDGHLSAWQATTPLNDATFSPVLLAPSTTSLLLMGGEIPSNGGTSTSNLIYQAVPDAVTGNIPAWPPPIAQTMDVGRERHSGVRVGNHIYVFGGHSSNAGDLDSTLNFTLDGSGAITGREGGPALDEKRYLAGVAATSTHVYVVGGTHADGMGTDYCSTAILSFAIQGDGSLSAFASTTVALGVRASGVIIHNDRLYVLGGWRCPSISSEVVSIPIAADGSLEATRQELPMPSTLMGHGVVLVGDRLYAMGGDDGSGPTTGVFATAIKPDGSFAGWQNVSPLRAATAFAGVAVH